MLNIFRLCSIDLFLPRYRKVLKTSKHHIRGRAERNPDDQQPRGFAIHSPELRKAVADAGFRE